MSTTLPCWPTERAGELLELLARRAGLSPRSHTLPTSPRSASDADTLEPWLRDAGAELGLDVTRVSAPYLKTSDFLRRAAPAIVLLRGKEPTLVAIAATRGRRKLLLLGPDHETHVVTVAELRDAWSRPVEAPHLEGVERVLQAAGIVGRRRRAARASLLDERLARATYGDAWLLAAAPHRAGRVSDAVAHLGPGLAGLLLMQLILIALFVGAWWVLVDGILRGEFDLGRGLAWALALVCAAPLRAAVVWQEGRLSVRLGAWLKERLIYGVMRSHPDDVRGEGVGAILGRVLEASAVERLALESGWLALRSTVELLGAMILLSLGAGGGWLAAVLLGWLGLATLAGARLYRRQSEWTVHRRDLSHALIERMLGHRTRLAQLAASQWYVGEDEELSRYVDRSARFDRSAATLEAGVARGWVVVALAVLTVVFALDHSSVAELAIALGGVLWASRAFRYVARGASTIVGAKLALGEVTPLLRAARRPQRLGRPLPAPQVVAGDDPQADDPEAGPLVEARGLSYSFAGSPSPVFQAVDLTIQRRELVLLEGPSGSGKSTLGAILVGLRTPSEGHLVIDGLDRSILGESGWRRRTGSAPQFHDNRVLVGTLAFNLLLSGRWPAVPPDLAEAERVCRHLGLGPLLERMPGGLHQMVGEGGWRLSHGEQSRLFLARALLQEADLLVIDESLAALDPFNLGKALDYVMDQGRAIVLIAHP